jgi:hypothetical protein
MEELMSSSAPNFAVSVNQPLHVRGTEGGDGIDGELLAIGWNVPSPQLEGVWPREGLFYLVLDRRTGLPAWLDDDHVQAVRHERSRAEA